MRQFNPTDRFLLAVFIAAAALMLLCGYRARAEELDQHERHGPPFDNIPDLIRFHASSRGLRPQPILDLLWCESRFDPEAIGDHGPSLGLAQLSTLPTGLYAHFLEIGYSSAWDTEQAVEYLARVASGEFLPGQPSAPELHTHGIVSSARWSGWQ